MGSAAAVRSRRAPEGRVSRRRDGRWVLSSKRAVSPDGRSCVLTSLRRALHLGFLLTLAERNSASWSPADEFLGLRSTARVPSGQRPSVRTPGPWGIMRLQRGLWFAGSPHGATTTALPGAGSECLLLGDAVRLVSRGFWAQSRRPHPVARHRLYGQTCHSAHATVWGAAHSENQAISDLRCRSCSGVSGCPASACSHFPPALGR